MCNYANRAIQSGSIINTCICENSRLFDSSLQLCYYDTSCDLKCNGKCLDQNSDTTCVSGCADSTITSTEIYTNVFTCICPTDTTFMSGTKKCVFTAGCHNLCIDGKFESIFFFFLNSLKISL